MMIKGPAIHPNCATDHARDSTPAPITPVIICATALSTLPNPCQIIVRTLPFFLFNIYLNGKHDI